MFGSEKIGSSLEPIFLFAGIVGNLQYFHYLCVAYYVKHKWI